jgi:colanic acid/amylovoran biosynthesis glycosyltransferase
MRIACVVDIFPTVSETFILNQIVGLLDRGHQVDIVAKRVGDTEVLHPDVARYDLLRRTRYIDPPNNKVLRALKAVPLVAANVRRHSRSVLAALNAVTYGRQALSLKLLYAAAPLLRGYDIIHCQFGPNGVLGATLRNLGIKGKLVTTFHGYDIRLGLARGAQIYRRLFDEGDCFIAVSRFNRDNLVRFGLSPEKIVYLPVGIDLRRFPYRGPRETGTDKVLRLVSVARLVEEKGLQYGIRAVRELVRRQPGLAVTYDIVGAGPLHDELASLVEALGLGGVVRLLGARSQPQVLQLLQGSDIFLLPSLAEALGVVLMESQAVGLPVVATTSGGTGDVVLEGKSGFLVTPGDAGAFADKLEYLALNPARWVDMGIAGRRHIEETFDVNTLNDRLVGVYEHLLSGQRVTGGLMSRSLMYSETP